MLVRDVMTATPLTIDPEAPVETAVATMRERCVRHLPVVDNGGELLGIVTDRDLRSAIEAQQRSDFGEGAATGVIGDLLAKLEGRERHELDEIDAAQRRLEAGVFGTCEGCHHAIPLARLRAMPAARRCATCQTREETER
jgi:RNA polymerase-binding transcription factor DksA